MKGENETGVKSTSEDSEGARPRWFWHVPRGERDQIRWVELKSNKGLATFGEKRMVRPEILSIYGD